MLIRLLTYASVIGSFKCTFVYSFTLHIFLHFKFCSLHETLCRCMDVVNRYGVNLERESPAVADKPARRESMPKIAPIRRPILRLSLTILVFIRLAVVASEICEIPRNCLKIQTYRIQGHPRSSILVPIKSAFRIRTFLLGFC